MILSKASKLTLLAGLLCLLLMGFTGASYGQTNSIRWNVFPSPTEVINTGRSEVLGSISLYVMTDPQNDTFITGNSLGGPTQIGITYGQNVQIDNTITTGIRVYAPKFATTPIQVIVQNTTVPFGTCSGFITLNMPPNVTLVAGDVIRLDGVRGRIDMSQGRTSGTNLTAQMQSINDPSANQFFPENVRVATSFPGMVVTAVTSDTATLCLPKYGAGRDWHGDIPLNYKIDIQEGFVRAFVARDSNIAGPDATDRLDSSQWFLGQPNPMTSKAVGTRIQVVLNSIPASVTGVEWPDTVPANVGTFSSLGLVSGTTTFVPGVTNGVANGYAWATYEYFSTNQAGSSDTSLEKFSVNPALVISLTNQADVGIVRAGASLTGATETFTTCADPVTLYVQPRFITVYQSYNGGPTPETTDYKSQTFGIYGVFAPCKCYLLFPYITSDVGIATGGLNWDTGISISNTSDDQAVFGTMNGAPRQTGAVTFYLYDANYGYVGAPVASAGQVAFGKGLITLASQVISKVAQIPNFPAPATAFFPYTTNGGFHGYMIVKTEFQFCHGYAFVSDMNFNKISQGYVANVIPDPAVKGKRGASAAADVFFKLPAGESLNN